MRHLMKTSCLGSLSALLAAAPAFADTTIGTSTSSNLATSTANAGTPDNLVISSGVTVSPASGSAVTIDSSNTVSNAGTLSFTDVDNVVGIAASGGLTSGITNSGTITATESYTATDTNGDSVVDAPFAQGTGRYGIRIGGSGTFTGAILNSGTITAKGNASAGIFSLVPIAGSVTTTGTITVTGDNSYGIRLGAVSGAVALGGTTTTTGAGTIGAALTGDVGGAVVVHGSITATGYTSTTLPTTLTSLTSGNLLQGGSALVIGGNVAGGVLVAASTTTTTDTTIDSDADGIADASEGAGSVLSYGSAPAILVGSGSAPITLGLIAAGTGGLVINGSVEGAGVYAGFNATAIQIGGLGGGVTITGGATVAGTVRASANGGTATAILVGTGATLPSLTNAGAISASSTTTAGGNARAISIAAGASLPAIANTGTISAAVTLAGGAATTIGDASGTLTTVTNTGTISASDQSGTARAIDVSSNTSGFTYIQSLASTTATAPTLTGAIVTGSGSDVIAASAGKITSALNLGAGNNLIALSGTAALTGSAVMGAGNDKVTLADTSSYTGTIDFGAGNDELDIAGSASFSGQILNNAGNVALSLQGGTASFTSAGVVPLRSLALGGGTLGVTINPATGDHTQLVVAGATSITSATTIKVALTTIGLQSGSYTVISSGTLTGSSNLALSVGGLPYLLVGSLTASDAGGTVNVNIVPRTPAQLGLTRSEGQAYAAVYQQITGNATLNGLFLGLADQASTVRRYRELLPDYAGGIFDLLTQGARALEPGDTTTPWAHIGGVGLWVQQAGLATHQDQGDTDGYRGSLWGLSAGGDVNVGAFGRFGLSAGVVLGTLKELGTSDEVATNLFQVGPYWMAQWGGLRVSANGSAGLVSDTGRRSLTGTSASTSELLSAKSHGNGLLLSAGAKLSYEAHLGPIYLRPGGTISYYRLRENAHTDHDGGDAFDLSVQRRTSDETAATGGVAVGVQLGKDTDPEDLVSRIEVEGSRRAIVGGTVGATTAQFAGGSAFTLDGEDRTSGYVGTLRGSIGTRFLRFVATGTYEKRDGYRAVVGRIGVRGSF